MKWLKIIEQQPDVANQAPDVRVEAELVPVNRITSVIVALNGKSLKSLHVHVKGTGAISYKRLAEHLIPAAIEALGIGEALGITQKSPVPPKPASVDDDARRYQQLKQLLDHQDLILSRSMSGVVSMSGGDQRTTLTGANLNGILDRKCM